MITVDREPLQIILNHETLPSLEEPHFADGYIASVIEYAAMDDVEKMKTLLRKKIKDLPINHVLVEEALQFGEKIHAGKKRKQRDVDFYVHPLGVALAVTDIFGKHTSTEDLIEALLHDSEEDGRLEDKSLVTKKIIEARFGERNAFGIDALSNVTDRDGKRRGLEPSVYYTELREADLVDPELHIIPIKVLADRMFNLFDPANGELSEAAKKSRNKKIEDNLFREILLRSRENDSDSKYHLLEEVFARGLQVAQRTVTQKNFTAMDWARQVRTRQKNKNSS